MHFGCSLGITVAGPDLWDGVIPLHTQQQQYLNEETEGGACRIRLMLTWEAFRAILTIPGFMTASVTGAFSSGYPSSRLASLWASHSPMPPNARADRCA